MTRTIKATDLHTRTRDVIEWARVQGQTVLVEYYGRPAVVIVGYDEYEDFLEYKRNQQTLGVDASDARTSDTVSTPEAN